ncbi:MAG: 23S rRNA (pseudouridine(1915)-N(3))-methyltransferase RlmH [Halobacteriovoraceae bacterium]|nr:23S rRNA (pseudouridine(1915)-N(3))-methyltransferase RlmH [Halobacteriovoraceae bacterium]|tara:strand:+ start:23207 stop:23629 length:423 start_codon:yes stop_codon:yes gene_type:complete
MKLITVGKLKDTHLEAIEKEYLKRLKTPKLEIIELKASAENKDAEAEFILKKLTPNDFVITLTEWGKEFDSVAFSKWLYTKSNPVFVICGAEGPGQKLLERSNAKLSLSKMTMPHKLARIVFVEQLYRAQTIYEGHPYHN